MVCTTPSDTIDRSRYFCTQRWEDFLGEEDDEKDKDEEEEEDEVTSRMHMQIDQAEDEPIQEDMDQIKELHTYRAMVINQRDHILDLERQIVDIRLERDRWRTKQEQWATDKEQLVAERDRYTI